MTRVHLGSTALSTSAKIVHQQEVRHEQAQSEDDGDAVDEDSTPLLSNESSGRSGANSSAGSLNAEQVVLPADSFYDDLMWPEREIQNRCHREMRMRWAQILSPTTDIELCRQLSAQHDQPRY